MERVDGTQARLKHLSASSAHNPQGSGKGGWDSGEIETCLAALRVCRLAMVERVDGTQARLKLVAAYEVEYT